MDLDNQQRIIYLQNNEFFDNHTSYYSEIRQNKQLFDVSIACEDEIFEAHKVILSASSLFFRQVLSQYQQPNPLIYLKGVNKNDFLTLMDFIYTGKTEVLEENIKRFMDTANELKIMGLITTEDSEPSVKSTKPRKKRGKRRTKSKKSKTKPKQTEETEDQLSSLSPAVAQEEAGPLEDQIDYNPQAEDYEPDNDFTLDGDNKDEVKFILELQIEKKLTRIFDDDNACIMHKCLDCDKLFRTKQKARYHAETHIQGFSHSCNLCGRTAKTRQSLDVHRYKAHSKKFRMDTTV